MLVARVARELSIRLIDLRSCCLERKGFCKDMICDDGLHLTEEGQMFIGGEIADLVLAQERG